MGRDSQRLPIRIYEDGILIARTFEFMNAATLLAFAAEGAEVRTGPGRGRLLFKNDGSDYDLLEYPDDTIATDHYMEAARIMRAKWEATR